VYCAECAPDQLPAARAHPTLRLSAADVCGPPKERSVSRDFEPVVGQWYENVEENEQFRVITVDEDALLVEIEYLDGDIEELDMDTWAEFDLEKIQQPEGWQGADLEGDDEDEEDDEDEDDDWDEDDDDDLDDEEDEDEGDEDHY
jgi:hypothetical protein